MPRQPASLAAFPNVTGAPPRLSPPSDLGPDERVVFLDIIAASKPDAFKASDSPLLSAFCRAILLERRSAATLAGGYDKEALAAWNAAVKAVVALSMRLRLSPQSRAPNNPTNRASKPERPLSVYEMMALQEGGEDGAA
jgi:hypothetical protein